MTPDQHLAAAQRALEADPQNQELRQRCIQAHLRLNQRQSAAQLLLQDRLCKHSWAKLKPWQQPSLRRCQDCQKAVRFCKSLEAITSPDDDHPCRAAPVNVIHDFLEQSLRQWQQNQPLTTPPCLVMAAQPLVELDTETLDKGLMGQFPAELALLYRVFPLFLKDQHLTLAAQYPLQANHVELIGCSLKVHEVSVLIVEDEVLTGVLAQYYVWPDDNLFMLP